MKAKLSAPLRESRLQPLRTSRRGARRAERPLPLPTELFTKVSRSLLVNRKSVAKLERKNLLSWDLLLEGAKEPMTLSNLESKRLRQVIS